MRNKILRIIIKSIPYIAFFIAYYWVLANGYGIAWTLMSIFAIAYFWALVESDDENSVWDVLTRWYLIGIGLAIGGALATVILYPIVKLFWIVTFKWNW